MGPPLLNILVLSSQDPSAPLVQSKETIPDKHGFINCDIAVGEQGKYLQPSPREQNRCTGWVVIGKDFGSCAQAGVRVLTIFMNRVE